MEGMEKALQPIDTRELYLFFVGWGGGVKLLNPMKTCNWLYLPLEIK